MFYRPPTEQPNSNQSSFGPGNQQSTFVSPGTQQSTQQSPWAAPSAPQQQNNSALPWQQSSWTATQNNIQAPQQQQNVGHDGSFQGMNREQWRDSWLGSGMKDQAGTDSWLSQHGATKLADNGTFMTPYGEILDLGQNYRTGNVKPAWTSTGMGAVPQNQGSPFGPPVVNYNGASGPNWTGSPVNETDFSQLQGMNPSQLMQNPIFQQLMQQVMSQSQTAQGQIPKTVSQISPFNPNVQTAQAADISSFLAPRNGIVDPGRYGGMGIPGARY